MYRPARVGRSCERFGGYKTINRIPLYKLLNSNKENICSELVLKWNKNYYFLVYRPAREEGRVRASVDTRL